MRPVSLLWFKREPGGLSGGGSEGSRSTKPFHTDDDDDGEKAIWIPFDDFSDAIPLYLFMDTRLFWFLSVLSLYERMYDSFLIHSLLRGRVYLSF